MTKYIAKRELIDQDWKTQLTKGYGNIPQGAECKFIKSVNNLYGNYVLVEYNNYKYYVNPYDLEKI